MKIVETTYNLELTKNEIEKIVKALAYECEYEAEQIAELKESTKQEDHIRLSNIKKSFNEFKELRNFMANIIGVHYMGD